MDRILTAGQSISMLERLRDTVNSLKQREAALIELRDRELLQIRRKADTEKARLQKHAAASEEQSRALQDEEKRRLQHRFEARRRRIDQAFEHSRTGLEEAAEQTRSQQKYENQKVLLQAQRDRDAELQSLEAAWKSFAADLSMESGRLEKIGGAGWHIFKGYRTFKQWLRSEPEMSGEESPHKDARAHLETLREQLQRLEAQLRFSPLNALSRLFSALPVWALLIVLGIGAVAVGFLPQVSHSIGWTKEQLLGWIGGGAGVLLFAYAAGYVLARGQVRSFVDQFLQANVFIHQCQVAADQNKDEGISSIQTKAEAIEQQLEKAWQDTDAKVSKRLEQGLEKLQMQRERLSVRLDKMEHAALDGFHAAIAKSKADKDGACDLLRQIESNQEAEQSEVIGRFSHGIEEIMTQWQDKVSVWISQLCDSRQAVAEKRTDWNTIPPYAWKPPVSGEPMGCFAECAIDVGAFLGTPLAHQSMALTIQDSLRVPLSFVMPSGESVLFETDGHAPNEVIESINLIVLNLLMSSPVGRMRFTLIDPVGLGQNFAGLMHLADYDDQLINRRIWTQGNQIEECLVNLTEHMEKVTQMYLRNEYESLAEYNQVAGNISEKYHVCVIADFPAGFSESSLRKLQSMVVNGARCGVFVLIHRDRNSSNLDSSMVETLQKHCVWIESKRNGYQLGAYHWDGLTFHWNDPPDSKRAIELIHKIGQASVDSNRVEVPFTQVIPGPDEIWSQTTSTMLRVPIGRTGASKLQYLTLGKGTEQHALIAGKTGSGKSTLFHVMVTNLALWCAPDQVEFYLIDFKKGVEFKCYATHQLPHARAIAIESDREFGLSVLERVDQELRRRGDLFREKGVQDLKGYHQVVKDQPLPRTLVMIDEFQEYFVEDDRVAQNAAVLLDRIVRQGRAFGIHVILGSQTLGGAYTLARTTFAQMVVRIALQCDEADAYLIMGENNSAPRLLSRPGEGIYNNSSGAVEGNSPFQTVWLTDAERDEHLRKVSERAQASPWKGPGPVVFEGNAPADIGGNEEMEAALRMDSPGVPGAPCAWLGAPHSIKGPTRARFEQQTGSNLLVLGQNEEMSFSLLLCSVLSLAAQYPADGATFVVLDAFPEHSNKREILDHALSLLPQKVITQSHQHLEEMMVQLDADMDRLANKGEVGPTTYVIVMGLQLFKKLKPEDEFGFSTGDEEGRATPSQVFERMVRDGASVGMHVLASIDSYNSAQRFLNRKTLSEFEMRVLFQMSANDSAALIDSTKASQLGLHRALFYNERKGAMETFRPYTTPDGNWLSAYGEKLKRRALKVT